MDDVFESCPAVLLVMKVDGSVIRANGEAMRVLGEGCGAGRSLLDVVHVADRDSFATLLQGTPIDDEPVRTTVRIQCNGDAYRTFSWSGRRAANRAEIHAALVLSAEPDSASVPPPEDPGRILKFILDKTDVIVTVAYPGGRVSFNDGVTLEKMGLGRNFLVGGNLFEAYGANPTIVENLHAVFRGEDREWTSSAHNVHWEAWFTPVKDADGKVMAIMGVTIDKSDEKRTIDEMQTKIELIERQQQVIRNLETPIIELWDRVVTLPMVGVVDSGRAARVMDDLLSAVSRLNARFAILDLTGVDTVDTATASHLVSLVQAIRLLGAEGIITGIRPTVAQTVVSLGLDLSRIATCSNLREGLKLCLRRMKSVEGN